MTEPEQCSICSHSDKRDLGTSLAHWRDAPAGMGYSHITACVDRAKCRQRVADQGSVWPLVEQANDHRRAS